MTSTDIPTSAASAPPGAQTGNSPEDTQASAAAAAQLRALISEGQLVPGAKLAEHTVAFDLGVSRNTLREAFTMLAAESLVDRQPHRGVFVARPTADDVREIYTSRRVIEPAAIMWGECSAGSVAELGSIIRAATQAREAADIRAMGDANQRFHGAIMGLTGSDTLVTVMNRLLARMRLVFHSMSADPAFHGAYVERNAQLLDLLEAGERERAAHQMRDYLSAAEAELLEHMA